MEQLPQEMDSKIESFNQFKDGEEGELILKIASQSGMEGDLFRDLMDNIFARKQVEEDFELTEDLIREEMGKLD